jgi:ubiquitin-protein ligase
VRSVHRASIYLHGEYPRRPPVITWETPIIHPNILGPERNGGVCIGMWSASESLADLMRRLVDLASYRSFNPADALDIEAARLVTDLGLEPGVDLHEVVNALPADPVRVVRLSQRAVL